MSEELEELRLLVARLSKDVLGVLAEREALRADRDRLAARVAALQAEVDACGDIIGQEHGATFGHAEIIEETIKEHQADNVKLAARVAELESEVGRVREEIRWHMAVDGLKGSQCWNARECHDARDRLFALVGAYPPADVMPRIRAALSPAAPAKGDEAKP